MYLLECKSIIKKFIIFLSLISTIVLLTACVKKGSLSLTFDETIEDDVTAEIELLDKKGNSTGGGLLSRGGELWFELNPGDYTIRVVGLTGSGADTYLIPEDELISINGEIKDKIKLEKSKQ